MRFVTIVSFCFVLVSSDSAFAANSLNQKAISPPLLAHRAIYDLSLANSDSASNISAVTGRLVFELNGSSCKGYTDNSRLMTQVDDLAGKRQVTDLRSHSYETGDGQSFQFSSRTFIDGKLSRDVNGKAVRETDGISVQVNSSNDLKTFLGGHILFPTQQMIDLIRSAKKQNHVVQSDLFDGSEDGQHIYATTAIIGKASQNKKKDALAHKIGTSRFWPVSLSYFDLNQDQRNEETPVYTLAFHLYENGVSRSLQLEYKNFVLSGKLVELDILKTESCP